MLINCLKQTLVVGLLIGSYDWLKLLDIYTIACVVLILTAFIAFYFYFSSEDEDSLEIRTPKPLIFNAPKPNPFSEIKLKQLRNMDPFAFERYIAILLQTLGYSDAYATQEGGDGGKDVIFTDKTSGKKCYSECKRYSESNTVGRPIIQKLVGSALADNAVPYAIFTTGRFTQEALVEARKTGVKCIGPRQLMKLIEEAGMLHEQSLEEVSPLMELNQ